MYFKGKAGVYVVEVNPKVESSARAGKPEALQLFIVQFTPEWNLSAGYLGLALHLTRNLHLPVASAPLVVDASFLGREIFHVHAHTRTRTYAQVPQGVSQEAEVDPGISGTGGEFLGDADLGAGIPASSPGQYYRENGVEGRRGPYCRQDEDAAATERWWQRWGRRGEAATQ